MVSAGRPFSYGAIDSALRFMALKTPGLRLVDAPIDLPVEIADPYPLGCGGSIPPGRGEGAHIFLALSGYSSFFPTSI